MVKKMSEQNINLSISEGDPLFAHEVSLNFSPTQIMFDFKCITPRIDPRVQKGPVVHIKHNVVMMEPYHAKKTLEVLKTLIDNYEKEFGTIKVPKSVEVAEKKHKTSIEDQKPTYFG
jgi:hypothetical protein